MRLHWMWYDDYMRFELIGGMRPRLRGLDMFVLELESTVTSRGQTTVPAGIRKALGVEQGAIVYRLDGNGTVTLARKEADDGIDPAVGAFLRFLGADIEGHPERLRFATENWVQGLRDLVAGVEIDIDQPLSPDDE